jgi:hypothetical protein
MQEFHDAIYIKYQYMKVKAPKGWNRRKLERRSEALFGASHRLPIAVLAAELEPEQTYAAAIAPTAKVTPKQAGDELKALEQAGVLRPLPPTRRPGQRGRVPQTYERRNNAFWDAVRALMKE